MSGIKLSDGKTVEEKYRIVSKEFSGKMMAGVVDFRIPISETVRNMGVAYEQDRTLILNKMEKVVQGQYTTPGGGEYIKPYEPGVSISILCHMDTVGFSFVVTRSKSSTGNGIPNPN